MVPGIVSTLQSSGRWFYRPFGEKARLCVSMWYHILRIGLTTCTWCREFRAAVLLYYWSWSQIKHSSGWSAIGARRPSLIPSMIVYARIPIIAPSSQKYPKLKQENKQTQPPLCWKFNTPPNSTARWNGIILRTDQAKTASSSGLSHKKSAHR